MVVYTHSHSRLYLKSGHLTFAVRPLFNRKTLIINVRSRWFSCGMMRDETEKGHRKHTHTQKQTQQHHHQQKLDRVKLPLSGDFFKGQFTRELKRAREWVLIQFVSIYSFLTESNAQKAFELATASVRYMKCDRNQKSASWAISHCSHSEKPQRL